MNSKQRNILEQAVKISWSRRNEPNTLSPGTCESIMSKVMERAVPGNRSAPLLELSAAASGLAWAACVLAFISAPFGVSALSGLKLTASYMAYFIYV